MGIKHDDRSEVPDAQNDRARDEHMVRLALPEAVLTLIAERAVALIDPSAVPPEPWVGVPRAAEHLDCTPRRIYDLVEMGRIPCRREGRHLKFRLSDLDAWLDDGTAALAA